MEETKKYYIRKINKLRRKTTSIMNKINNNKTIGPQIYENHLHKFQQLDNTILVLEDQLNDLQDIYEKTKSNNINKYNNESSYKNLTKKELDILMPLFCNYYNLINNNNNINNINNNDLDIDNNIDADITNNIDAYRNVIDNVFDLDDID